MQFTFTFYIFHIFTCHSYSNIDCLILMALQKSCLHKEDMQLLALTAKVLPESHQQELHEIPFHNISHPFNSYFEAHFT